MGSRRQQTADGIETEHQSGHRHPSGAHGRVLAVINGKGGTGKSTTAINVAGITACLGHRTLLVDLDDQGTATAWLGHDPEANNALEEVLVAGRPLDEIVLPTAIPKLDLAPGSHQLVDIEQRLREVHLKELLLREALAIAAPRDIVVIDTPGDLELLTTLAVGAAGEVLITVPPEVPIVRELPKLERYLALARRRLNPELSLAGVLACRVPFTGRYMEGQARDLVADLRAHFGDRMLTTVIIENQVHGLAMDAAEPVNRFAPGHRGDLEYRSVVTELGIIVEADEVAHAG